MQQLPKRVWKPEIGSKVKLRTWNEYASRELPVWSWFRVENIETESVTIQRLNGDVIEGQPITVPIAALDTPIGWQERYLITVRPKELQKVLEWFSRGITVRQSHYMPTCATAFQPMDNDDVPGWQFVAGDTVVDRIPSEQCEDLFAVSVLETEWDIGVPDKCKYCANGKRTRENNPVLIGQDGEICPHCGIVAGFSFDKPYHAKSHTFNGTPDNQQCANVRQPAECWVCDGTGIGKRYLSEMTRTERNRVIAQMHAEGWKVNCLRHERAWMRERETVVKQFGQTVSSVTHGKTDEKAEDSSR